MKILFCSSGGGHWVQLQRLAKLLACDEAVYIRANAPGVAGGEGQLEDFNIRDVWRGLRQVSRAYRLVKSHAPDVVLSTGAAPGLLLLLMARLQGRRCIWIDSIANSRRLSLSARAARLFCQHVLTQWPDLAKGRVKYLGRLM